MLLEYGEHHFCFINLKPLTVSPCNETFNSPIDSLAHQCQPPPPKKKPTWVYPIQVNLVDQLNNKI